MCVMGRYSSGLFEDFVLSIWEERKVRLYYGEHSYVHQSHSQNTSGDLRGVAGGDGELGCLCEASVMSVIATPIHLGACCGCLLFVCVYRLQNATTMLKQKA